ncbi:MAG: hypothetical protein JW940_32300, partial [Polyangiaceae bacterium]|nr:hypothetical protein [Polyangiaceae bacterium]
QKVAVEPPQVSSVDEEPQRPQKADVIAEEKVAVEPPQAGVAAGSASVGIAAEAEAAPAADPAAKTGAEMAAPSKVAEAATESTAVTAADAPAVPASPRARPVEQTPQARRASKSAEDVPHAAADETPAASPAEARQKSQQATARDAKKPSPATERRPRPVSAEPSAQRDRQRRRAPTAAAKPHRARAWIGFAAAIAALAGAAYLSAPIWLPPARPTARTPSDTPRGTELDARVGRARTLIDAGDLAAAKPQLDSALALSENDARVLVETARWHVQKAELAWWRSRMYDAADGALAKAAREDLKAKLAAAETAVERAGAEGELAPALRWARPALDRMAGDLAGARQHTAALTQAGWVVPEYAQAALALAGGSSDWAMAARQLGKAASLETSLGPSRFGLIFVLANSAQVAEALAQLNATARQPSTEALFQELETFLQRSSAPASNTPDAGAASDAPNVESAAALDGDFRRQLTTANDALRAGQLTRAERLYRAVLDTVPGNTEALSGLADVARARNDSAGALHMYQRVLQSNPGYLPALMAVADQKRQSGDRQGASVYYRRVLEQAGTTSSYGTRASQRLRELETSAVSERVADAGQSGTPRSGEFADRPSPSSDNASHEAAKPSRDAGAQPSGRGPGPRRTGSPNPKDFLP